MQTAAQPQGGRGAKSDNTGCQIPHFTMVLVPGPGRLNDETDAHSRVRRAGLCLYIKYYVIGPRDS